MPYRRLLRWITGLFRLKKSIKIGIYGPPNSGKTSLANRIISDFVGSGEWKVSPIPHETRRVQSMREVVLRSGGKTLTIDLFDMPGITTRDELHSDYFDEFILSGMNEDEAKKRLDEATEGIKEAVSHMRRIDGAVVVLDSTKNPYNRVNALLLGVLRANNVKVIVAANKIDLSEADAGKVRRALHKYPVVEISCTDGTNMEKLYESIIEHMHGK